MAALEAAAGESAGGSLPPHFTLAVLPNLTHAELLHVIGEFPGADGAAAARKLGSRLQVGLRWGPPAPSLPPLALPPPLLLPLLRAAGPNPSLEDFMRGIDRT